MPRSQKSHRVEVIEETVTERKPSPFDGAFDRIVAEWAREQETPTLAETLRATEEREERTETRRLAAKCNGCPFLNVMCPGSLVRANEGERR